MNKKNWFLIIMLLYLAISLKGGNLPFYLDWSSSDGISFYDFQDLYGPKYIRAYKIRLGVDTLVTSNLRARIELTNLEQRLFSQTIFDHVMIDYRIKKAALHLSMEDMGYGKGFLLFNRRTDDALFEKNALLSYRWYGTDLSYLGEKHSFGTGVGGNELNQFISHTHYSYSSKSINANLFGLYVHRHSNFTEMSWQGGFEAQLNTETINFHSAFIYEFLPENTYHSSDLDGWNTINELTVQFRKSADLILSTQYHSQPKSLNPFYDTNNSVYQACLDVNYGQFQSYLGYNQQDLEVSNTKASTGFLDVNWLPRKNLSVGLFFDVVDISQSRTYYRFGLQTRAYLR